MANSLEEIVRLREKHKTPKEIIIKGKDESIEPLLQQIEEGGKIQETLNQQPSEKNKACERLEIEIILLRKELEKENPVVL